MGANSNIFSSQKYESIWDTCSDTRLFSIYINWMYAHEQRVNEELEVGETPLAVSYR